MEMFANFDGAGRPHLGGGDQNIHLADLEVERPQSVVVDVGDDAIQHAQPNGNALAGDLVNHRLHMLGSHFMSTQFDCICKYRLVKSEPVIFPEGIRTRGGSYAWLDSTTNNFRLRSCSPYRSANKFMAVRPIPTGPG